MANDESILDAARAIRPFLQELVPLEAAELDKHLADLLAQAVQGEKVTNKIVKGLSNRDSTREWVAQFLKEGAPPVSRASGSLPPPGDPKPVLAPKYVCPQGDYTWYQMSAGSIIPSCPTHHVSLVRVP
jgi:hypothetical protein